MNTIVTVNPLLNEQLFQHIWKFRLFNQSGLATLEGAPIQVLHPGTFNTDAGPDFIAARIKIGEITWAGNVELHLKTSDWYRHGHHYNQQYDNVVLHVVFYDDMHAATTEGIPCLELQQFVPKLLLERFHQLKVSADYIPCGKAAAGISHLVREKWKERLMIERLDRKADRLQCWLVNNQHNWEEVCYWAIAESFGLPANRDAFLQLAQSVPYPLLMRHRKSIFHLEALLFGQAGLLEETFKDEYPQRLQQEYQFLRHKYKLQPISTRLWKWLRMRPASFPAMRIACLAAFIQQSSHLFSRILETQQLAGLEQLVTALPSFYWLEHYRFDKQIADIRHPGQMAVQGILINAVIPLLYLYGREKMRYVYQERAVDLLSVIPAENNRVMREWKRLGMEAWTAADSQALLELKNNYCQEKRCLECSIGLKLLKDEV